MLGNLNRQIFKQQCIGGFGSTIQTRAIDDSMLNVFRDDTLKVDSTAIVALSLKKIVIILSPAQSLKSSHCSNSERTRSLNYDSPVPQQERWEKYAAERLYHDAEEGKVRPREATLRYRIA